MHALSGTRGDSPSASGTSQPREGQGDYGKADEVSPSHVVTLIVIVCVLLYVRNGKSMFNLACRELAIA